MNEERAFASERCPHCGFWLVGGKKEEEWFCTVCGSQITDPLLLDRMEKKAVFKQSEPGQWVSFQMEKQNGKEVDQGNDKIRPFSPRRDWKQIKGEWKGVDRPTAFSKRKGSGLTSSFKGQ